MYSKSSKGGAYEVYNYRDTVGFFEKYRHTGSFFWKYRYRQFLLLILPPQQGRQPFPPHNDPEFYAKYFAISRHYIITPENQTFTAEFRSKMIYVTVIVTSLSHLQLAISYKSKLQQGHFPWHRDSFFNVMVLRKKLNLRHYLRKGFWTASMFLKRMKILNTRCGKQWYQSFSKWNWYGI